MYQFVKSWQIWSNSRQIVTNLVHAFRMPTIFCHILDKSEEILFLSNRDKFVTNFFKSRQIYIHKKSDHAGWKFCWNFRPSITYNTDYWSKRGGITLKIETFRKRHQYSLGADIEYSWCVRSPALNPYRRVSSWVRLDLLNRVWKICRNRIRKTVGVFFLDRRNLRCE